ncbi:unnamed protein product [Linum trigynum]|uniref:Uncharacterized protein n=1 Tax=Linum trigynum TaxID=586398 RepID=A0AAV2E735_9ROSI
MYLERKDSFPLDCSWDSERLRRRHEAPELVPTTDQGSVTRDFPQQHQLEDLDEITCWSCNDDAVITFYSFRFVLSTGQPPYKLIECGFEVSRLFVVGAEWSTLKSALIRMSFLPLALKGNNLGTRTEISGEIALQLAVGDRMIGFSQ